MKMPAFLLAASMMATPALAAPQSFKDVSIIDVACSKQTAADADSHTRDCALGCKESGFGIVTADKKFLKFDASGNAKILEQMKASDKTDHLRVNVTGEVKGDTIAVTSVKLL